MGLRAEAAIDLRSLRHATGLLSAEHYGGDESAEADEAMDATLTSGARRW